MLTRFCKNSQTARTFFTERRGFTCYDVPVGEYSRPEYQNSA